MNYREWIQYLSLYLSSLVINVVSSHGHGRALLHTCLPSFLADGRDKLGMGKKNRKFYDFSTLRVHISKTIYRSGMGPSPACSLFNSAQNEVFWCISVEYLGRIVLIDDAVSHWWRHRSDLWRHGSVTWHAHMIVISRWVKSRDHVAWLGCQHLSFLLIKH